MMIKVDQRVFIALQVHYYSIIWIDLGHSDLNLALSLQNKL